MNHEIILISVVKKRFHNKENFTCTQFWGDKQDSGFKWDGELAWFELPAIALDNSFEVTFRTAFDVPGAPGLGGWVGVCNWGDSTGPLVLLFFLTRTLPVVAFRRIMDTTI